MGAAVRLPRAYRASPLTVSWKPALPGDCTELTAWARAFLIGLGWPPARLERWICKTERGKKHAVLIVAGVGKDKAIDCRVPGGLVDREILLYRDWAKLPD